MEATLNLSAEELRERALACVREAKYDEAIAHAAQALARFEERADSVDVVTTLGVIGRCHEMMSRYEDARTFFERAMSLVRAHEATNERACLARMRAFSDAGRITRVMGRYVDAERLYLEARDAASTIRADHEEHAALSNQLGMLYKYMGRFEEADSHYQEALVLLSDRHGADSPLLADLFHNLGGLEHARAQPARGEPYARRAVALRREVVGETHVLVAQDLAALAAILDEVGKIEEAETIYRQVLDILEKAFGECHYDVAVNQGNLAALLHGLGRFEDAETLYRRALATEERLLGRESVDVAMTLSNLAAALGARGQGAEALLHASRACEILETSLGPDHPHTRTCKENEAKLRARS